MRAGFSDRLTDGLRFVRSQIVEDNDVAFGEGGREFLFDIGEETLAVDRPVEQAGRVDPVVAQCRQESRGIPMTAGDFVGEPPPALLPAVSARHVVLGPGLVDEDEAPGIDQALIFAPPRAVATNVRPLLLASDQRLMGWPAPPSGVVGSSRV